MSPRIFQKCASTAAQNAIIRGKRSKLQHQDLANESLTTSDASSTSDASTTKPTDASTTNPITAAQNAIFQSIFN